jgi:hypothetical protein
MSNASQPGSGDALAPIAGFGGYGSRFRGDDGEV